MSSSSVNGLAKAIKGFVISDADGEVSALENCVGAACPGLFKFKAVKTTVGCLRTELMHELGESSIEGERDDYMQHFVVHFYWSGRSFWPSYSLAMVRLVVTKLAEWTKAQIPVPPAVAPLSAVESKEENLFLVPLVRMGISIELKTYQGAW
jgi:hypothetical protein